MASLSICSLVSFFSGERKSLDRGENHFKSDHVQSFIYSRGVIKGEVQASMKNKDYKVTVSCQFGITTRMFNSKNSQPRFHLQFNVYIAEYILQLTCLFRIIFLSDLFSTPLTAVTWLFIYPSLYITFISILMKQLCWALGLYTRYSIVV